MKSLLRISACGTLPTIVLFLSLIAAARSDEPAEFQLQTSDTELVLAVADNSLAIERLAAVGEDHNWLSAPCTFQLMTHVWHNDQAIPLRWRLLSAVHDRETGCLTATWTNAQPALRLRSIWRARPGRGPVEHWIELVNESPECVTIPHQDSLTLEGLRTDGPAELWWIKRGGSNASTQGGTFRQTVEPGVNLELISNCEDGASPVPWMAVQVRAERGLYVGWEFSGLGRVAARTSSDSGLVNVAVGNQPDFKTDVEPGETFLVPPAFVGCYAGDLDEGSYSLHRFVIEKLRPAVPADCPDPILAYNLYLDVGGNRATESDVLRSAETCRDLGFEAFMPDAMWFPETGDWRWDPRRFPRGITPIEQRVHAAGMKMALWCAWTNGGVSEHPEALSVRGAAGHPQWFNADYAADWQPGPFYGGQVCLADPEARQWEEQKTQWLVREHKLDYLKHDCGPIATRCTKTSHRHHYGTDASYWATVGYYQVQERLRAAFPHLLLENCSGGGHIKDFGVIARTHYTVSTDTLSNLPNRQTIFDSSYALPPLVLQCYTYDNYYPVKGDQPGTYLWRSAMMGAWQIDPTDTPKWTEEEKASVRRSVKIYRDWIRPMLTDVRVHHVLPRPDGVHWDGMFYWSPAVRRGTLYVWRPESPDARQTVLLKGLDPDRNYWLWSEDGSLALGLRSGHALMNDGVTLELPDTYTSDLVFVQDESLGKPSGVDRPGTFRAGESPCEADLFSVRTRLSWEPAAGAHRYVVSISESGDFATPIVRKHVLLPTLELTGLPPDRDLYWRVEAWSWGGNRMQDGAHSTLHTPQLARPAGLVFLSEVDWVHATAGADNSVRRDTNYYGKPLSIGHVEYPKGLWTHAFADSTPADITYTLAGQSFARFVANVGLDDASNGGSVVFQVLVDGRVAAESPVMRPLQMHELDVNITGARELTLRVLNAGDGYACDHAVWGGARLLPVNSGID